MTRGQTRRWTGSLTGGPSGISHEGLGKGKSKRSDIPHRRDQIAASGCIIAPGARIHRGKSVSLSSWPEHLVSALVMNVHCGRDASSRGDSIRR
jgi:hypothetical protein